MIRKASAKPVLLDTHAWIWLMEDNPHFKKFKSAIDELVPESNILVSTISLWEVAMIESKRRIRFPVSVLEWLRKAVTAPGLRVIPISPEIAVESCQLPELFHGDPADKLLIATARIFDSRLVTHDKKILTYAQKGHLEVLAI